MLDFDYTWTAEQMRSYLNRPEPAWDGPFKDENRRMQCIEGFDEADERRRIGSLIDAYWRGNLTTEAFINRFEAGLWPAGSGPAAAPAAKGLAQFPSSMIPPPRTNLQTHNVSCLRCDRDFMFTGPPRGPVVCPAEGCGGRLSPRGSDAWVMRYKLWRQRCSLQAAMRDAASCGRFSGRLRAAFDHAQEKFDTFTEGPARPAPDDSVHLYGRDDGTIGFVANSKVAKFIAPNDTGGVDFQLLNGQTMSKKMYLGVSTRTRALEILDTEW